MSTALARADFSTEEQALIQKQFFPAGATPTRTAVLLYRSARTGAEPDHP